MNQTENNGYPHSCIDCGVVDCQERNGNAPAFCITTKLTEAELDEIAKLYTDNEENQRITVASATVESAGYGHWTRVEEIMQFAKRMGYHRIGIATCVGLLEESRIFARILRKNGFDVYGVGCKVGSMDKVSVGIPEEVTENTGCVMCNPILQAKLLNKAKTDLNVVVGLCVGHDSLFYKYAEATTTTLVTKDRVMAHNPVGALYQSRFYYRRLLDEKTV